MSGKTAMGGGFLVEQSCFLGGDHLRGQATGWIFRFDDGKRSAVRARSRWFAPWLLEQEFQSFGDKILERPALKRCPRLGLAEKVVRQVNSRSHKHIFAY